MAEFSAIATIATREKRESQLEQEEQGLCQFSSSQSTGYASGPKIKTKMDPRMGEKNPGWLWALLAISRQALHRLFSLSLSPQKTPLKSSRLLFL
jgi:hypothetical protein